MKENILGLISNMASSIIATTGSWLIYGEKQIPDEIIAEYNKEENK